VWVSEGLSLAKLDMSGVCPVYLVFLIHIFHDLLLTENRELMRGIPVTDEDGNRIGESKV